MTTEAKSSPDQSVTIGDKKVETREFKTGSGIPLKEHYSPEDIAHLDYQRDIAPPGQYPYTRGPHPTMYRSQLWTFRQYSGYGQGEDTNARWKFLLANGQTGLSMALDLPTQLGLDSDDPRARAEVGRVGVAIDTLEDFEKVFDGLPLDKVSTSFTINATAAVILAMYAVTAERQGVPVKQIRGTVQNDVLKEYVARGTYIFPPRPSIRITGDIIEWCHLNAPKFNAINVSAPHMAEAGATLVQSVAYMFLDAIVYMEEVLKRGYTADDIAPVISFISKADRDFFESICCLRACRRFWARLMRDQYDAKSQRAMLYRAAQGGDCEGMTREQPLNNIARITLNALANSLGGTQSMLLPSYDEVYAIPTEEAARTSLMVQAIVAHESNITSVVDPLAGSYFIESLTDSIEQKIKEIMDEMNSKGGIVKAIETGLLQRIISTQAYQRQRRRETGEDVVVGVNRYVIEEDYSRYEEEMHVADRSVYERQVERLRRVKAERDNAAVEKSLAALKDAARGSDNLMPLIVDAVRVYASMGEIIGTLKEVYGGYRPMSGL